MTTYYVRPSGASEPLTEHPTDGDATAHAGAMAIVLGGVWVVIRKTGRLSTVTRRIGYPKVNDGSVA